MRVSARGRRAHVLRPRASREHPRSGQRALRRRRTARAPSQSRGRRQDYRGQPAGSREPEIQEVFVEFARELGFVDEHVGLFAGYESAVRPDYFLRLGQTGILLEVERGKTTTTWTSSTSGSATSANTPTTCSYSFRRSSGRTRRWRRDANTQPSCGVSNRSFDRGITRTFVGCSCSATERADVEPRPRQDSP